MSALLLYLTARAIAFGLLVYAALDAIQVATSREKDEIERRGMTYRLTGALWGVALSWLAVEDLALKALWRVL